MGPPKCSLYNENIKGCINNGFVGDNIASKNGISLSINGDIENQFLEKQTTSIENGGVPVVEQKKPVQTESLKTNLIGCFLSLVAAFILAVGQSCVQLIQGVVGDFQLVAMRQMFQACLAGSFFVRKRRLPRVARDKWHWMFITSVTNASVNVMFGISVTLIPAGNSSCVRRSIDVILMTILSAVILKERLTAVKLCCVAVCLTGVIMIIQPWYSAPVEILSTTIAPENFTGYFLDNNSTESLPSEAGGTGGLSDEALGYTLASLAGVTSTFSTLFRKHKLMEYNTWSMNFYTGFIGCLITGTIALSTETLTFPSETDKIIYVVIQTMVWGCAALCRQKSVTMAPALIVTMIMSMQIVFLLIGQYTILKNVKPGIGNWVEITGAVLVVIAIMVSPAWQIIQTRRNYKPSLQVKEEKCDELKKDDPDEELDAFDMRF